MGKYVWITDKDFVVVQKVYNYRIPTFIPFYMHLTCIAVSRLEDIQLRGSQGKS